MKRVNVVSLEPLHVEWLGTRVEADTKRGWADWTLDYIRVLELSNIRINGAPIEALVEKNFIERRHRVGDLYYSVYNKNFLILMAKVKFMLSYTVYKYKIPFGIRGEHIAPLLGNEFRNPTYKKDEGLPDVVVLEEYDSHFKKWDSHHWIGMYREEDLYPYAPGFPAYYVTEGAAAYGAYDGGRIRILYLEAFKPGLWGVKSLLSLFRNFNTATYIPNTATPIPKYITPDTPIFLGDKTLNARDFSNYLDGLGIHMPITIDGHH